MPKVAKENREVDQNDFCEPANSVPSLSLQGQSNGLEAINDVDERPTPLPKFQLFLVLLIQFAEPISAIVIYPFVNQFVRDTGITQGDDKKTGYYAGVIESAFFFAEAATVFQWGRLSDRFGRRPILLLGPLGLTFAMVKFGFSTSFWAMVGSRCMQGVFNGNIGVSKTVLMELTDPSNIGDAVAMIPLIWSVGTTIAPIMGGVLSNPAVRWPSLFGKVELFTVHPYLLPCLAASVISLLTFVVGFLGLKETHPLIVSYKTSDSNKDPKRDSESLEAGPTDPLLVHDTPDYGAASSSRCASPTSSDGSLDSCLKADIQNSSALSLRSVLMSRTIRLIMINYLFLTFTDMCYTVLMPLIYSTSIENGGLGLTPYQIGLTMGIWGFMNAFVQMNLLGKFIRKYGANRVYRVAYTCYFVSFLTYPVSTYLARRSGGVGMGTRISILIQLMFQFGTYMSYGAMHVAIAESAPKSMLGSINGLFQMAGCLMRTFAPTFASSLFSMSIQEQILGGNLVYFVFYSIFLVGIGFSHQLPNRTRKATPS